MQVSVKFLKKQKPLVISVVGIAGAATTLVGYFWPRDAWESPLYSSYQLTTVIEDVSQSCGGKPQGTFKFRSRLGGMISFGEITVHERVGCGYKAGMFYLNGTFRERLLDPNKSEVSCLGVFRIVGTREVVYTEWRLEKPEPGYVCPQAPYRSDFEMARAPATAAKLTTIYY